LGRQAAVFGCRLSLRSSTEKETFLCRLVKCALWAKFTGYRADI